MWNAAKDSAVRNECLQDIVGTQLYYWCACIGSPGKCVRSMLVQHARFRLLRSTTFPRGTSEARSAVTVAIIGFTSQPHSG